MPNGIIDFGFTGYVLLFLMIVFLGPYALFNNMIEAMGWGFGPTTNIFLLENVYIYPLGIGLLCVCICVSLIARSKKRSMLLWSLICCVSFPCIIVLACLSKVKAEPVENIYAYSAESVEKDAEDVKDAEDMKNATATEDVKDAEAI